MSNSIILHKSYPVTLVRFTDNPDDKINVQYVTSKSIDTKYSPSDKLMIITCCMVKRDNPTVPIPMSVNGNVFITLFVENFNTSINKQDDMCQFIDMLQDIFESEHETYGSYYHDVLDHLVKTDQDETFHNKMYGHYCFYDDSGEYLLVFSINYTPTIIRMCSYDKDFNNSISEHAFEW